MTTYCAPCLADLALVREAVTSVSGTAACIAHAVLLTHPSDTPQRRLTRLSDLREMAESKLLTASSDDVPAIELLVQEYALAGAMDMTVPLKDLAGDRTPRPPKTRNRGRGRDRDRPEGDRAPRPPAPASADVVTSAPEPSGRTEEAPAPEQAPAPDAPAPDGPAPDAPAPDGPAPDAPAPASADVVTSAPEPSGPSEQSAPAPSAPSEQSAPVAE